MKYTNYAERALAFIKSDGPKEINRLRLIEEGTKVLNSIEIGGINDRVTILHIIKKLKKLDIGSQKEPHAFATGTAVAHFVELGYQVIESKLIPNKDGSNPDAVMVKFNSGKAQEMLIIETETQESVRGENAEKQIDDFIAFKNLDHAYNVKTVLVVPNNSIILSPNNTVAKYDAFYQETGLKLGTHLKPSSFQSL